MKWQYAVIATSGIEAVTQNRLNEFGAEGWELVDVENGFLYLKRPIPQSICYAMWDDGGADLCGGVDLCEDED